MTKSRGARPDPEQRHRPKLTRPRAEARQLVVERIANAKKMQEMPIRSQAALEELRSWSYTWHDGNRALIKSLFSTDDVADEYAHEGPLITSAREQTIEEEAEDVRRSLGFKIRRLEGVVEQMQFIDESDLGPAALDAADPLETLLSTLRRFPSVARRLRVRHGNRPTIEIADEYDLQDLLSALLLLDFEDVRPEEYAPSYAGGATRIDYLLKDHAIVVETKMTRSGHADRLVGEELILDIARYRSHPDAKTLVSFVYDPEGHLSNAPGLKNDLEDLSDGDLRVVVIVAP